MSVGSISGSGSSRSSSSSSSSSASQSSRGSEESRTSKGSRTSESPSSKTSSADRFSRSSFEAAPAQGNPKAKAGAQPKTAFNLRNPKGVAFQSELQAPRLDKQILRSETFGPTSSFQKGTPGGPGTTAFERTPRVSPVPAMRQDNPGLAAINAVNLVAGKTHSCVTTVRANLQAAGMKGVPTTTGNDKNNARGMMAQMLQSGHWRSVEIPGSTRTTIPSNYGDVQAHVLTREAYLDAASKGLIPEGSVVFQTKHGWDYGEGAYGNDVGIVRNGAIFNYEQNNTMSIYSGLVSAVVLHPN